MSSNGLPPPSLSASAAAGNARCVVDHDLGVVPQCPESAAPSSAVAAQTLAQLQPPLGGMKRTAPTMLAAAALSLSPDVSECRRCRRCRSSVGAVSERCRLTLVSTVSEVSGLCLIGV